MVAPLHKLVAYDYLVTKVFSYNTTDAVGRSSKHPFSHGVVGQRVGLRLTFVRGCD